jgi:MFS family permease
MRVPVEPRGAPSRQAWLTLGGAFLAFTVSATLMHSYTVFLVAFVAEFAWTRAESSLAYSVGQLVGGISAPLAGGLVDRIGPRRMVLLGGSLMLLGLLGTALADALWQVVLLYGVVMTLGAGCIGMVVFAPLISGLFVLRRGMAISVLQSANGFGRALSAPIAQLLVNGVGWRMAYVIEARALALLVFPLAAIFRPARLASGGPAPAGAVTATMSSAQRHWSLAEAMRTPDFWLLFVVYICTSIGSFLVALHQLAFAVDAGFDPLYAASVIGIGSFLALPGVILTGAASDHIGREASALIAYAISIAGVACALLITGPDQHLLLWLHACRFGVTWGARGPAVTAKTADLFPGPRLGTIIGVITVGSGLGAALGAWGAGWIFDATGSYRAAFVLSILAYLGGSVAFWALRRPRHAPR